MCLQALAEQKIAAAKEKELETARLRAKQERAADRQAEIDELRAAIRDHAALQDEANHARVREELGDLMFAATNIARHMQVEPEAALKLTNRKFRQRFEYIENALRERKQAFDQTSIDELEELWQEAKKK